VKKDTPTDATTTPNPAPTPDGWPAPMKSDALHGITGGIVETIAPQSEGDPAGLVLNHLVAFGNIVDARPHIRAESDRHFFNLFVAEVGASAKSRKGTSWGRIREVYRRVDPGWEEGHIQPGARTGEGLIRCVADDEGGDAGASDKRLLLVETEMGGTLRIMNRHGNSLSMTFRQAWDGGTLRVLTRRTPLIATNPHISILFHTTRDDLSRFLDRTDIFNGFSNRVLWAAVRRSKLLPDGGQVPEKSLEGLAGQIRDAVDFAKGVDQITLSRRSRDLWREQYPELTADTPGMVGAATSRAESQVIRIAGIYALLDKKAEIRTQHLKAALAVWDYCFDSARFIFGDRSSVSLDDKILRRLRQSQGGLTKTELSAEFFHHVTATGLRSALDRLERKRLIVPRTENTGGRPAQRWLAVKSTQPTTNK